MKRKLKPQLLLLLVFPSLALWGQQPSPSPSPGVNAGNTTTVETTMEEPDVDLTFDDSTMPNGDAMQFEFPDETDASGASFGSDETISVDFPEEEIRTILRNVADLYDLNLVIPDTLEGNTSIKLRNVTWREVFDVILEPIAFTWVEDRNIIKVKSLEDLAAEPVDTRVFLVNYADATSLQESVGVLVDSAIGGRIQVDQRSNALIITERPSRMNNIQEIIERLDRPTEQVMIESKFIEVTNRDTKNIGVNWTSLAGVSVSAGPYRYNESRTANEGFDTSRSQTDTDAGFINDALLAGSGLRGVPAGGLNYPSVFEVVQVGVDPVTGDPIESVIQTFPGITGASADSLTRGVTSTSTESAVFSASALNVVLSALKTVDDVKLVSNPTVVTLNNTEALISIGERFPVPQYTYNDERGTFEVSGFEYTDIGINLDVTPQVNSAGFINLDIRPEVSTRQGTVNFGGASGAEIPIIGSRRTETNITIKDGYTLAIGGLVEDQDTIEESKVPILGDIPGLGRLFRSETTDINNRNLIIFITAKTLNPDGSTYRDIIDPRVINEMGITERDVPGDDLPASEMEFLNRIYNARQQASEAGALEALQGTVDAINAGEKGPRGTMESFDDR